MDFQADSLMQGFDEVIAKARGGELNTTELKGLLLWMPAQIEDGSLDSVEVDSLKQRVYRLIQVEQQ